MDKVGNGMDKPMGLKGLEIDSIYHHLDFPSNLSFAFVFHDDGYAGLVDDDDDDYEMFVPAYLPHSLSVLVVASPVLSQGQQQ
jgi:hypothetical protein